MKVRLLGFVCLACLALPACTESSSSAPPAAASAAAAKPASAAMPPIAAATAATTASPQATTAATPDALVGQVAPDFTLPAQDGPSMHLAALKGKPVVLYFYPKDETPGCTKEACSFRDSWQSLAKTGAVLIGVSADTLESHKAFTEHYKLPFHLVSDPKGEIAKLYGVPFESVHSRQTIVIGADGKVLKVYRKVDVTQHAQQVLGDLGAT